MWYCTDRRAWIFATSRQKMQIQMAFVPAPTREIKWKKLEKQVTRNELASNDCIHSTTADSTTTHITHKIYNSWCSFWKWLLEMQGAIFSGEKVAYYTFTLGKNAFCGETFFVARGASKTIQFRSFDIHNQTKFTEIKLIWHHSFDADSIMVHDSSCNRFDV